MIGLTGAHRTGKTTIAKEWAESMDLAYVPLPRVLTSMGLEPKDITTMDMRLKVQRKMVEACGDTYLSRRDIFISDRTPIDVAAYTLADMGQSDVTEAQQKEAMAIVEDCFNLTNAAFGSLIYIAPGIPYIQEEGKPLPNEAYQEHVSQLILGLCADQRMRRAWYQIPRGVIDQETRLLSVSKVFDEMMEEITYEAEASEQH